VKAKALRSGQRCWRLNQSMVLKPQPRIPQQKGRVFNLENMKMVDFRSGRKGGKEEGRSGREGLGRVGKERGRVGKRRKRKRSKIEARATCERIFPVP